MALKSASSHHDAWFSDQRERSIEALPVDWMKISGLWAALFTERVWRHGPVLLGGASLAPGKRTSSSLWRVMGLGRERRFHQSHRALNRASWSASRAGRVRLEMLIDRWAPTAPLVGGLDDTIERCRGEQMAAKGIYRAPVRSSQGPFVKARGLRWLSVMLLAPVP